MTWGWDSQVSGNPDYELDDTKVFANSGVVFGIAGSLRLQNVLKYMEVPEAPEKAADVDRYVLKTLSDAIRHQCSRSEVSSNVDGQSGFDGCILLSVLGRVYELSGDFCAMRAKSKVYGIGSGSAFALGALAAGADPLTSLKIAAKMDTGTGGRLYVKTDSEVLA